MKGRPPKPAELKVLQGNPGKRPIHHVPKAPIVEDHEPPAFLDDIAKAEWRRVTPGLIRIGLLTTSDVMLLAAYCANYSRWFQAETAIRKEGSTYDVVTKQGETVKRKNPNVDIAKQAMELMRSFASDFGLSPVSRTKAHASSPTQEKQKSAWDLE